MFIDNRFLDTTTSIPVYSPATEELVCEVSSADSPQDVDAAVCAAKKALGPWRDFSAARKAQVMLKFCDLLVSQIEIIASIDSLVGGKPYYNGSQPEISAAIATMRYYAGWTDKIYGEMFPTDSSKLAFTKRGPIGVCGMIVPWNFPLLIAFWKIAPAIACGNTVVVKTSEFTPLSLLYCCKFVEEAGLPPGVINVISGYGKTTGSYLASHKLVDKVSFTGSTATGQSVMEAAKSNLKNVTLECGGKSPMIVLEDANVAEAAKWAHLACMSNMGQICSAISRVYVHESRYEEFIQCYEKIVRTSTNIGDPFEKSTTQGPQINAIQLNNIRALVIQALEAGAQMVCGHDASNLSHKGHFMNPVILRDVNNSNPAMKEEIFGPVVCIDKFSTDEEAIEKANDSKYGLIASIFTESLSKAHKLSDQLQAGQVYVNSANDIDIGIPFGGVKLSGIGTELGEDAIGHYTQVKSVSIRL